MGPEYQSSERSKQQDSDRFPDMTYQDMFDLVRSGIEDIEATGSIPLAMEHPHHIMPYTTLNQNTKFPSPRGDQVERPTILFEGTSSSETNPTLLPDTFLFSFTPVVTIRHPARVLPSFVRAKYHAGSGSSGAEQGTFLFELEKAARFRWERLVFESFNQDDRNPRPIVIDGDKLAQDPQSQMRMLCERLGIDANAKIEYTWDPAQIQETFSHCSKELKEAFFGTLNKSSGVIVDKNLDKPILVADERRRWAEEWGEELASQMEHLVCEAMEDYLYLRQFAV
ncbi:hypothetical protein Moror_13057 [Moniliophthora roreri MCA 2997]|nr:hypothetical protein Moror_13057 [Moniliophthora roreri MCA 2997]